MNDDEQRATERGGVRISCPKLFPIHLTRLTDHDVSEIGPYCRHIQSSSDAWFYRRTSTERLDLPKIFIAAEALFGRSSKKYDDYKGSFGFPLLLSAVRDGVSLRYVVMLEDRRGATDVNFHRIDVDCDPDPRERSRFAPPVDSELGSTDLDYLTGYLLGYLLGYGEGVAPLVPAFYRTVPSELLVYGRRGGELFEREFDDREAFDRAVETIERELGPAMRQAERGAVAVLLDRIAREGRGDESTS
jgi:hypothetical protein